MGGSLLIFVMTWSRDAWSSYMTSCLAGLVRQDDGVQGEDLASLLNVMTVREDQILVPSLCCV